MVRFYFLFFWIHTIKRKRRYYLIRNWMINGDSSLSFPMQIFDSPVNANKNRHVRYPHQIVHKTVIIHDKAIYDAFRFDDADDTSVIIHTRNIHKQLFCWFCNFDYYNRYHYILIHVSRLWNNKCYYSNLTAWCSSLFCGLSAMLEKNTY